MNQEKHLFVLVGCIGSGKSTLALEFEKKGIVRISQDVLGKKGHMDMFEAMLETGTSVCIDRMNFNKEQRARYIKPAKEAGYAVTIFEFKTCPVICRERALKRTDHPNIKAGDEKTVDKVIKFYHNNYESVEDTEFDSYNEVK